MHLLHSNVYLKTVINGELDAPNEETIKSNIMNTLY